MRQVILIPDETGWYTVEAASLPGCISQGATIDEAIALHIENMIAHVEEVLDDQPRLIRLLP